MAGPNKTSCYVTIRTRNFQILQPGTSGFSNQLVVSALGAKFGTSGFALAAILKCAREAFCVSHNLLGLIEH